MRKPPVALLVPLALVMAAAVGCTDDQPQGRLGGVTLEVMAYWSGPEQKAFTEVLDRFERETGAEVRYISGGDDLPILLQTRLKGDNPPNVAITQLPGLIADLARTNELTPLNDAVTAAVDKNYKPVWKELGTIGGKLYSVYFKATDKSTFWYNDNVITGNGLETPDTWASLVDLCVSLADLGITPMAVGAADGWVLSDWFENVYLQVAGPEMYDKLSRHEIPWTHESVHQTFGILNQILGRDALVDGHRDGALQVKFQDSVRNVFGPNATAAMLYEGDFVAGVIKDSTTAKLGVDAKVFPFPKVGESAPGIVVGGDAAVALTDDPATMELMGFLAAPESGMVWAGKGGFLSPNKQVPLEAYPDDGLTRSIADQLMNAEQVRFDMSDLYPAKFGATPGTGIWKAMQDIFRHPEDITSVLEQLDRAVPTAPR